MRAHRAESATAGSDPEPGGEPRPRAQRERLPLLVTAHRARDILSALRIASEFGIKVVLDGALAASTIDAARILGLDKRLGSLEVGKDGDLALYDGDPFEYTSHCVGVVIDGVVVEEGPDS